MKYEEVDAHLIDVFFDFAIDEIDEGLPYCVAGSFARYLLDKHKSGSIDTLVLAGQFIEELYANEDERIHNLATVGYLEAIQNVWGNNSVNPEEMAKYLGNESRKQWIELNLLWRNQQCKISTSA